MNNNNFWKIIIIGLVIGGFIWAMDERTKRKVIEEKLKNKEKDYLRLLSEYFNSKNDIPTEIKDQLINLRKEYIGLDEMVANKLRVVIELIDEGKEKIAIEKLATIIENLLKDKYIEEGLAKDKNTCPGLYTLLKKAKELKWIKNIHFNFSLFLKEQRNEEVHELIDSHNENEKYIAFFTGIEIIYKLKGIKRI